jgi:hypothetical protein
MEEVVVVEEDTLVMAAHRNNGPEPAAQMAAVIETKSPVIYHVIVKTKFQKKKFLPAVDMVSVLERNTLA